MFKVLIVILLLFVIFSLFSAFYYLVRDPASSTRVVKALFVRVGLSLFIMGLILVGIQFGWVEPHGFGQ